MIPRALLPAAAVSAVAACAPAPDLVSIVEPFLGPGQGRVAVAVLRDGEAVGCAGFWPADI